VQKEVMKYGESKWLVIEDHEPEATEPLEVRSGDVLRCERRPTEWDGWIWCTDSENRSGWVPENRVAIEGSTCKVEREYTSAELGVRKGEELSIEERESGWAWAENSNGERGWVPLRCLERMPDDTCKD
jgi:hypothetical protein